MASELDDRARYMKKKVKGGPIEVDPDENAIIVHYEVEATILGDYGEAMMVERKQNQKKIRVKTLNEHSDIPRLAEQIVQQCRLIHVSKLPLVEDLLFGIQQRQLERDYKITDSRREADQQRRRHAERGSRDRDDKDRKAKELQDRASMEELDDYIEKMYDTMEEKIKATYLILQLARNPDNLEALIQNETLLGVLSRLLKDDGKRSLDLTINIIYIFYSFSNFSQFHSTILQYHTGEWIMRVIDLEIRRYEMRSTEDKKGSTSGDGGAGKDQSAMERALAGLEEVESRDSKKTPEERERKLRLLQKKQEKLLYVCFHVLLNLAEDINIERKMKKRKIVPYLISMLDRRNIELLILVVTFLKKLAIFRENKNEMIDVEIVEKLSKVLTTNNEVLLAMTLRLLFNLSFDPKLRDAMVKNSLIPKLVELLKKPAYRLVILRLLYHLSIDDRCKSMFTYTDCIPMVLQLVVNYPEKIVQKELIALAVNLTGNSRNAESMSEGQGFGMLMKRMLTNMDPLLMKVLRNISMHDGVTKHHFVEYGKDLVCLLKDTNNPDHLVEVLGTLANLNIPEMQWAELCDEFGLVEFLQKHLVPGFSEDDVALEVIMLLSTLTSDPECSSFLAVPSILRALFDMLTEKQEDDEIVLQLLYCFYKFSLLPDTRDIMLNQTHVVSYFIDLLQDKNAEIRKTADATLDVVMDYSTEWSAKIKLKKFQLHNADWLEIIEEDDAEDEIDDDVLGKMRQQQMYEGEDETESTEDDVDDGDAFQNYGNIAWDVNDLAMPDDIDMPPDHTQYYDAYDGGYQGGYDQRYVEDYSQQQDYGAGMGGMDGAGYDQYDPNGGYDQYGDEIDSDNDDE